MEEAVKEEKKIRAEIRDVIRYWNNPRFVKEIRSTVIQANNSKCDISPTP